MTGKYHLFAGYNYYPGGALDDYRGSFDDFEDAKRIGTEGIHHPETEFVRRRHEKFDWANIVIVNAEGNLETIWYK